MKKLLCAALALAMLTGCGTAAVPTTEPAPSVSFSDRWAGSGHITVTLSPEGVTASDPEAVTTANDIIYYESGHDESYGEGEEGDAHTAEEAAAHTVVHITKPGTYVLTGDLPNGQIAVDLGEDAETDPNAVVTLILDGVNITNTVAPAVIFYNVYECGDAENPAAVVDTSAAGANVILAEGSVNTVSGSHVAKIYKPGTDKKLHKYDGAFYSKMSMNIGGEGALDITADNEGLDSELHLTINSGTISITSGNDGINTNEDGVSVTTINGGLLSIHVTGSTGEGDGIDSNGWLVINGGEVRASACGTSGDAGIDSDMGILINGGTVCASGNMLDRIEDGSQTHAVFTFSQPQEPGVYTLKDDKGTAALEFSATNRFQYLILSAPGLTGGTYTLWNGETQYQGAGGLRGGFHGGQVIDRPDWPDRGDGDVEIPPQPTNPIVPQGEAPQQPTGDIPEQPEQMPMPELSGDPSQMPVPPMGDGSESMTMPEMPDGVQPPQGGRPMQGGDFMIGSAELTAEFVFTEGANYFMNVQPI